MIKKFSSDDLNDMIKVGYEAYSDYGEDLLDSPDKTLTFVTWPIAHGYYLNGECVGSVYGYPDGEIFHIYSVEILHKYHKQGIGKILMDFCLTQARQMGFRQFRAYALSDGGKKLVAKYGFTKIGERKVAGNYTADIVVMNDNEPL